MGMVVVVVGMVVVELTDYINRKKSRRESEPLVCVGGL